MEMQKEKSAFKSLAILDVIALILLIVGGLNWLTVAVFDWNFVHAIFSSMSLLERIVYIIVGVSAIYVAVITPMLVRHERTALSPGRPTTSM
jgi:hypothetical protein